MGLSCQSRLQWRFCSRGPLPAAPSFPSERPRGWWWGGGGGENKGMTDGGGPSQGSTGEEVCAAQSAHSGGHKAALGAGREEPLTPMEMWDGKRRRRRRGNRSIWSETGFLRAPCSLRATGPPFVTHTSCSVDRRDPPLLLGSLSFPTSPPGRCRSFAWWSPPPQTRL